MTTHSIESITELLPETIQRFRLLFNRFCHDLDGAFERANKEYASHMPSKGDVCEAAVCKYLSESLGSRYAISTHGHVFDSTGKQSKEQDVVIFDDYWSGRLTPRDSGEPPLIPVESVYATIQVKKTLSSDDLRSAIENIRSIKALVRERVGPDYVTPNKRIQNLGLPGNKDIRNPYFSAIFAFTAGRSMTAVLRQLEQETANVPHMEWPDVIIVYKEGVILPYCTTCKTSATHVSMIASDGHIPSYIFDRLDGAYSLLGFHFLLIGHLHGTILVPPMFDRMYGTLAQITRLVNLQQSSQSENLASS